MKLTTFLLFVMFFQVSAGVFSQNNGKLNLKAEKESVNNILRLIEEKSEFRFLYNSNNINVERKTDINCTSNSIEEVLKMLFEGTNVKFRTFNNNNYVLYTENEGTSELSQQQKSVSGKVTDSTGASLPGVSVVVKGTTTGVITDVDGKYSLSKVPENATLQFSFVGMKSQEIVVGNKQTINVTLAEEAIGLEEVVAVGYGTQKKENLTGAVASVKAASFENRTSATPSNLLQGLSAGLSVSTSGQGGYPGSTSTIKVRNIATWKGGTDPLFVIDGFIRDKATFDNLNPNDIDNISVLKDAASASIYGMKSGNGVILVTTKTGSATKTEISYNANYTFNSPTRLPKVMNAYEQATIANSIFTGQGVVPSNSAYYADDELEYFKTHSYSTFDDSWKNPYGTNHNLSVRGGSEKVHYFVSGSSLNQGGGLNQTYDKYTVLAKLDGEITKGMTFALNLDGFYTNNKRPNFPYGTDQNMGYFWYYLYYGLPYQPGSINGLPRALSGTSFVDDEVMKNNYRINEDNAINGTFELKYKIPWVEGLTAKAKVGYNNQYTFYKNFNSAYKEYFFKTGGSHNHYLTSEIDNDRSGGSWIYNDIVAGAYGANQYLASGYSKYFAYQLDLILTYDHSFGNHNVSALLGYEPSENNNGSLAASRKYYNNLNYQEINGGSPDNKDWGNSGTSNYYGQASYFGRFDYNYNQKYLLGVTFRRDGDMRFAPNQRWGNFPAVSLGWNITKEAFFEKLLPYAEVLKPRFSYGLTGSNGNIAYWLWQQAYNYNTSSGMILGSSVPASITLGSFANPDITWEKNYNLNLGLDYSSPNRLISLTLDWWRKKTVDILDTRIASTPVTVGASLPAVNYGKALAQGLEISIGHQNKIGEFQYSVGANWSYSTNKYLEKDQAATTREYYNQIGRPIDGWITGHVATGMIRTQVDADKIISEKGDKFTIFGYKPAPGMIMYEDLRGPIGIDTPDGKIDANDATLLSTNGSPRITYGFDANVSWKGFTFSTIFSGFAKYDVMLAGGYNGGRAASIYQNNLNVWNDSWSSTNTNASYPSPYYSTQGLFPASTFWMRKGGFLRLKNVTLSYSLPSQYLKNQLLKGVKVYVSCENLMLWDHVKLYDPEVGTHIAYPLMKSATVGMNITF